MNSISKRIDNTYTTAAVDSGTSTVTGTIKGDFYDGDVILTFDDQDALGADSSGNGYTFTNTDVAPVSGSAPRDKFARFNGTTSNLLLTSPTDLNAEIGTTIAVGFWFKTTDTDSSNIIFQIQNDTNNEIRIDLQSSTTIVILMKVGGSTTMQANLSVAYTDDVWRHIVFTVDQFGNRLYLNGVKQSPSYSAGSAAVTSFPTFSNANSTQYAVGRRVGGTATQFYAGDMDDVFISGSFYSDSNVKDLYDATSVSKNSTVIDSPNDLVVYGDVKVNNPCIIARHLTSTQSIQNNTLTVVLVNEIQAYDGITESSGVFTLTEKGVYTFFGQVTFNPNATGIRQLQFIDGNGVDYGINIQNNLGASTGVRLATSGSVYHDGVGTLTLAMYALQNSGGNLSITAVSGTEPVQVHIAKIF